MSRSTKVVILCEDRQHEAFARRFLAAAGRDMRVMRVERSPKGRGAGEQFVRERYARELAYYRARKHHVDQALIVVIDADRCAAGERVREVEDAAQGCGQPRRLPGESVAIFVAARSIETWFAYLDGRTVSEVEVYPRLNKERDCQRHVDQLHAMCLTGALRNPPPPSLDVACQEYHTRLAR